ncbi:hypothetical protein XPN_1072, partial [Xanthomonas arboricola pv. pruni MAFF 301427]
MQDWCRSSDRSGAGPGPASSRRVATGASRSDAPLQWRGALQYMGGAPHTAIRRSHHRGLACSTSQRQLHQTPAPQMLSRFPIPDSRFPIPDSQSPIPNPQSP